MARGFAEPDAFRQHRGVIPGKIVRVQKEGDAAACRLADCGLLGGSLGFGEEEPGPAAPCGATTTQRLPWPRSAFSISAKPSLSVNHEIASS